MTVTDVPRATACLERIGYYRLSAYWYPYRKSTTDDDFRAGTTFSLGMDFYVFDKKLRLIVLDALERIEVGIRTDIALLLGKHDPWAHRDPNLLDGNFSKKIKRYKTVTPHQEWLRRLDDKFDRSKEDFAKHFKKKYHQTLPPIWVAVELWDFGTLSHFYAGMKMADRNTIAQRYGFKSRHKLLAGQMMETWLRMLNDIRNVCAHHSRLWNDNLSSRPAWTLKGGDPLLDHISEEGHSRARFYAAAVAMQYLLKTINPSSQWSSRLIEHIDSLQENAQVNLQSAGFPQDWREQDIWK